MTITHVQETARKFVVCPTCEGNGTHGPGHVYTQDDLDEQFGPDQFDVMVDYFAGKYDVRCEECAGKRVVRAECACAKCEADRREEPEYQAMVRA
jgi:hypothetical protein